MEKAIYFDMDGTLADFYNVPNWLSYLEKSQTKPYREARPLVNMRALSKEIKRLQSAGYTIGIISWLSKYGTDDFNERTTRAKMRWLARHLGSVQFDEIHIIKYGTPKQNYGAGVLFDDERGNRDAWNGAAYDVKNILEILRGMY